MRTGLLVILLCSASLFGFGQAKKFMNVGVADGLSNSWVKAIEKDSKGFIWIGTLTGLNRYDGYNFKIFRHNPDDPSSIADNHVATIFEDSKGRLWISNANIGYINLYVPEKENFEVFKLPGQDLLTANLGHIATDGPIFEDSRGILWVGNEFGAAYYDEEDNQFYQYEISAFQDSEEYTSAVYAIEEANDGVLWFGTNSGVVTFNFETKETKRYVPSEDRNSLGDPVVKAIHKDENGNIWLGTWGGGLHLYDRDNDHFIRFQTDLFDEKSINSNDILSLDGDDNGRLFVGTENGGVDILDLATNEFSHHTTQIDYDYSISGNSIYSVFYDKEDQILWCGTFNGGVDYWSEWSKAFVHHKAQYTRLNNEKITAFYKDNEGNLWIGTDGGGLNKRRPDGTYEYFRHDVSDPGSLMSDAVLAIISDSEENIWVGTYNGGIDLLNKKTGTFTHYRHDPDDPNSLGGQHVSSLCLDKDENIWAGTFDAGVSMLNRGTNTFTNYLNDTTNNASLSNNFVQGVFADDEGDIYVSTMITLDKFDFDTKSFRGVDDEHLDGVRRTMLVEDSQGNHWVGSANGLFKYDSAFNFKSHFTKETGLPDNDIAGILEDDEHNLWISTANGLFKFDNAVMDPSVTKIRTYTIQEGLQGAEYKFKAFLKDDEGIMYFGGQSGFNSFHPDQILEDPNVPPVVFTDFRVFNESAGFGEDELLKLPISLQKKIELPHTASVITFEYAALGYTLPEGNIYSFMMEGFDDDWAYVGKGKFATYTNLDAGDYTFRVKAANSDGVWNEEGAAIAVTIFPPFYNTWWFRGLLAFLLVAGVVSYSRMRVWRLQRNKKELENKVQERTQELELKNKELAQMSLEKQRAQEKMWQSEKMASLGTLSAGVGHEINNPLNYIKAGVIVISDFFKKKKINDPDMQRSLDIVNEGVDRTAAIVKSLNHFTDSGDDELHECNIREIVDNCLLILKSNLEDRVEVQTNYQEENIEIIGNESNLHQAIFNILSNAEQAIGESGTIQIDVKKTKRQVKLAISDTGMGISEDNMARIMDPFFTTKAPGEGTGMGLSIAYNIITEYGGNLDIASKYGEGTKVTIALPSAN